MRSVRYTMKSILTLKQNSKKNLSIYTGIFTLCLSTALGSPLRDDALVKNVMTLDQRLIGLVFGVDLRVWFMIIYRHAVTLSPRKKRSYTHGYKN